MEGDMGCLLFFLFSFLLLPCLTTSGRVSTLSIYPNFTASNFRFIDTSGDFLVSLNGTFKASITNLKHQVDRYYFSVTHLPSNTIIWTANRNQSISSSDTLSLTTTGLIITNQSNSNSSNIIWSTPNLTSPVYVMQLQDSGNLVLLDKQNVSLWESFDYPTDTLVVGQRLHVGKTLDAALNDDDLSVGDYRLIVTGEDAILQWNGLTYSMLSMDERATRDSSMPVSFLAVNGTGMYLYGDDGSTVVIQVILEGTDYMIAKLGSNGILTVSRDQFALPFENCRVPSFCGRLEVCSTGGSCSCPPGFNTQSDSNDDCVPTDTSSTLPSTVCNKTENQTGLNSSVSYLQLGVGVDYFSIDFMAPVEQGVNLTACEDLCSQNCSCLGIYYDNSQASCFLLENFLGSFMERSDNNNDRLGYIKALVVSNESSFNNHQNHSFPVVGLVLLPPSGLFLLIIISFIGFFYWTRKRRSRTALMKFGSRNSSSEELEIVSIPGLPVRFDYEALAAATENFKTQIGSGGFGTVYKGTLPDETVVAVKKITSLGIQGKKEFCTEIAIIGNIHHVNLVRLKGFCAKGRQRFLVLEYMPKGSLDRTLFGNGPVLEWQERFEIAIGTARGLAYLHSGCEHKIIHCDVKPENILLHDNFQVKISDFGLSKLLSTEQSSLFTTMRGTRGYLAPEWLTNSSISDKTDVYSYGMVLLEIIRGRKNCSLQPQSHNVEDDCSGGNGPSSSSSGMEPRPVYFPLFALEMHEQRRYLELADRRLEGRVTRTEVEKLVRVALCCVHEEPMLRPTMANVVSILEGAMPLGEPRVESLNFLRFYGRRFMEASRIEGSDQQNEFMLYSQANATSNSATSSSYNSLSFISSHQVSGPR